MPWCPIGMADSGTMSVAVVGAAIIRDGRLLAAQRIEPPHLAGGWELPGGKIEAGESDEEALVRECREELGVEVRLLDRLDGDWPLRSGLAIRVWFAEIVSGEPMALADHSAIRWLAPDELYDVAWLPADLPIVEEIGKRLAP